MCVKCEKNIKSVKLSMQEAEEIYTIHMTKDFPPAELKPFKRIRQLMEANLYACYGFYEEKQLCGYAFLCENETAGYALLDYYAIARDRRGQGYGQYILSLLRELYKDYKGIILESENPAYAEDDEDYNIRVRRIHFYEKAGACATDVLARIYSVEYCVFVVPCRSIPEAIDVKYHLEEIYRILVKKSFYATHVKIYQK